MLSEIRTGPVVSNDGAINPARADRTGAIVTANSHGLYQEAAVRKALFYGANQAATAWSVALATTFTGLVVSNPAGSPVNLAILQAGFALSVAPAAIASLGFFGGFAAAGITAHTTPLTPASSFIGNVAGYGKADAAATLVGTPVWLMQFMGGFTAGALPGGNPSLMYLDGSFIVPPGGYFGIAALTAVTGFASILWEEVAV